MLRYALFKAHCIINTFVLAVLHIAVSLAEVTQVKVLYLMSKHAFESTGNNVLYQ